jgi:hypothetical protein
MLSALKLCKTVYTGKVTIISGAISMFQEVCQYQFKIALLYNCEAIY